MTASGGAVNPPPAAEIAREGIRQMIAADYIAMALQLAELYEGLIEANERNDTVTAATLRHHIESDRALIRKAHRVALLEADWLRVNEMLAELLAQ